MARQEIPVPELEQFVIEGVELSGTVLGVGAYGTVEEAQIPGATVAAKKLHSGLIDFGSPEQVRTWIHDFVEECKLMSQIHHPNVVHFLGICYVPGSEIPVLLMEKLQTSLDSLLESTPNIPLDVKVYLLTGTSRGVVYLHSRTPPIIHRDLTARNILIDSGLTAKIADLGVARMVNIQPGQRVATMTGGPGNNLYMPPEAVPGEGVARYNTSIDIFSFGVVSLFTLTQTFPKDLKGANYHDPTTRRLVGRSEIERRVDYIEPMKAALGDAHPLVKLTLDCLEYLPEDRPSAVEVLTTLLEVGSTVPQHCTESKLQLIQHIQHAHAEHRTQISEKDGQINELQESKDQLQSTVDHLDVQAEQVQGEHQAQLCQLQTSVDRLQTANDHLQAEKQEQIQQFREEHQRQLSEKEGRITQLQAATSQLQSTVDLLQAANDYLQAEKEESSQQARSEHQRQQSERESRLSLLQESKKDLQATVDRLQAEKQEHIVEGKHQPQLHELEATVKSLQAANSDLQAANERLKAERFRDELTTHRYQLQMRALENWGRR